MNKKIQDFLPNCLAVECPELSKDWHPTKNLPLTTFNVPFGSGKRVWWQCNECKHEWQAHISNRRKQYKRPGQSGTGCPNCIGRVVNLEISFASYNPELIEEWHPSKNLPDTPYNIAITATKKYHWVCKICEGEWEATASDRSHTNGEGGCPTCCELKNRKHLTNIQEFKKLNREIVIQSKFKKISIEE